MRFKNDRHLIKEDAFLSWLKDNHSEENSYLFILGVGFDNRMGEGIHRFEKTGIPFDVWEIVYNEGNTSPSKEYENQVVANKARLDIILKSPYVKSCKQKHINLWQEDKSEVHRENNTRFVGEINASKMIKSSREELQKYSDILVDVSALPQTLYLSLLNTLFRCSNSDQRINIIVNENYTTDMCIEPVQAEEMAHEVQGFSSPSEDLDNVVIWYPILGEINSSFFGKYSSFLKTNSREIDEICPVVPFPSVNIRRADSILAHYSKMLFSDWGIDKKNIIYASETNPILVCDSLFEASTSYKAALVPLGACKFVFSAITSKLMTLGMLLVAYDLKSEGNNVSILGISNKGYQIKGSNNSNTKNQLICIAV